MKMVAKPTLEDREILEALVLLKEQTEDQVEVFQALEQEAAEAVLHKLDKLDQVVQKVVMEALVQ